jgi:hypothetical protein
MEFDFVDHVLAIRACDGGTGIVKLEPKSVTAFHAEVTAALASLGLAVRIWTMPQEVDDPIPFDKDTVHAAYAREPVERFWRAMRSVDVVLKEFRSGFIGKASPVHFFWGSFDLCVTRFSGRRAPPMPQADKVTREAYSHEVSSVGWWPGDATTPYPAFYAYASPEPAGLRRGHGAAGRGVLRQGRRPVPAEVRRRARGGLAQAGPARLLPEHL